MRSEYTTLIRKVSSSLEVVGILQFGCWSPHNSISLGKLVGEVSFNLQRSLLPDSRLKKTEIVSLFLNCKGAPRSGYVLFYLYLVCSDAVAIVL